MKGLLRTPAARFGGRRTLAIALAGVLSLLLVTAASALAQASEPGQQLKALTGHLDTAAAQVQAGDVAGGQASYDAFDRGWPAIERGVRQQSLDMYRDIEARMRDVRAAFNVQPSDPQRILSALKALDESADGFISAFGGGAAEASQGSPAGQPATEETSAAAMAAQLQKLTRAQQRIAAGDGPGAARAVQDFISGWPAVEAGVAAKDNAAYTRTEDDMAQAYGLLVSQPPNLTQAAAVIGEMQSLLAPYADEVRYGMVDAAIILLREGFEALLVFAALLAFVKRSGNDDKQGWIWAGGGGGLAVSILIALIVNLTFAHAGGSSREMMEGVTGLLAAGMLLWMMFWLHSKANIHSWNRYISERSSRALASNSLMGLAAIAFLAVLREGAETVLFYVGIAPAIETSQLLLGLLAGAVCLSALAVLMLVIGVRIPIRPFFLLTSVLVFFLAFKFAGMGVHALQVSGALQAHPVSFLPAAGFAGVFPTWESTLLQLVIVAGTALGLRIATSHEQAVEARAAAAQQAEAGSRA